MTNYWISWYQTPVEFELHSPWWISGYRYVLDDTAEDGEREQATICAAVHAMDEDAAKKVIVDSHDTVPGAIEWRFCEERPDDWTPFCDRFQRVKWMVWP